MRTSTAAMAVALIMSALLFAYGCGNSQVSSPQFGPPAMPSSGGPTPTTDQSLTVMPTTTTVHGKTVTLKTTEDGLAYYDVAVGAGAPAVVGHNASLIYTGALLDGTVFDASSQHGGAPFSFLVGEDQAIKGWDEGVPGMKVGGERILVVPAYLGYGADGKGKIPANATLVFDVKLVAVD